MVTVRIRGLHPWYLIENPDRFVKRWKKSLRRKRLFEVKYAGEVYWVNPMAIMMVEYKTR